MKTYIKSSILAALLAALAGCADEREFRVLGVTGPYAKDGGWELVLTTDRGDYVTRGTWKNVRDAHAWHVGARYVVTLSEGCVAEGVEIPTMGAP